MNNILGAMIICVMGISFIALGMCFISDWYDRLFIKKPKRGTFEYYFVWAGGIWGMFGVITGLLSFPIAILTLFLPF